MQRSNGTMHLFEGFDMILYARLQTAFVVKMISDLAFKSLSEASGRLLQTQSQGCETLILNVKVFQGR